MSSWNHNFTALIRSNRDRLWGNWGLDPLIRVGAVGILDPATGAFTHVEDALPGLEPADLATAPAPSTWSLRSEDVTRTDAAVDLSGKGTDPETGTTISAGLKLTWHFDHAGSLASEFAIESERYLDNAMHLLHAELPWLQGVAEQAGMGDGDAIEQGFGVITRVVYATSGLNVGADSDRASFSIEGSVSGVKEMLGEAAGHGHYSRTSSEERISHIIWPPDAGTISPTPVPIAFEFASFEGRVPIPGWRGRLSGLGVTFRNDHGGTYVVTCRVEYTDSLTNERVGQHADVSGGLTQHFALPLSATKVTAHGRFQGILHSDDHELRLGDYPLQEWAGTNLDVHLKGVWPGGTSMWI